MKCSHTFYLIIGTIIWAFGCIIYHDHQKSENRVDFLEKKLDSYYLDLEMSYRFGDYNGQQRAIKNMAAPNRDTIQHYVIKDSKEFILNLEYYGFDCIEQQ